MKRSIAFRFPAITAGPHYETPHTFDEGNMNDTSRAQGWAICASAGVAALIFLIGILNGSYWAIAIPVAIVTFFALGLVAWVGYTIATIQVETDPGPELLATDEPEVPRSSPAAEDAA
jgi:hypothetical protein